MKELKSQIKSFLRENHINEINRQIDLVPGLLTEFGPGVCGYDFSKPNEFYELSLCYDVKYDSLQIIFKELNNIINDCEIIISIDPNDLNEDVFEAIKISAIADYNDYKTSH